MTWTDEDVDRLKGILEAIKYKPGWEITYEAGEVEWGPVIRFLVPAQDARNPEREIWRHTNFVVPFGWASWDDDMIVRAIFHELQHFEIHEVKEWFQYKGEVIYDPHKTS